MSGFDDLIPEMGKIKQSCLVYLEYRKPHYTRTPIKTLATF